MLLYVNYIRYVKGEIILFALCIISLFWLGIMYPVIGKRIIHTSELEEVPSCLLFISLSYEGESQYVYISLTFFKCLLQCSTSVFHTVKSPVSNKPQALALHT